MKCATCERELEVGEGGSCWVCDAPCCDEHLRAHVRRCVSEGEARAEYHRETRESAQEQRFAELKDEGRIRRL